MTLDWVHYWGTTGSDLTMLQMCIRGAITFVLALFLLRISGRRSFGMRSPFDNTFVILLGSILAQGVIGKVDYIDSMAACFVLSIMHRVFAYLSLYSGKFGAWVKGDKILLFKDGKMHYSNMTRSLISKNDLMERLRMQGYEDLEEIKLAYMERNGEISLIKK